MKVPIVAAVATVFSAISSVRGSPVRFGRRETGTTSNEYTEHGCAPVIFFWARGSTEVGNMGTVCGPQTSDALKAALGPSVVATEGIDYAALIETNYNPGGADYAGIAEMRRLVVDAAVRCPFSKLVAAGYSQGGALTHRAVEDLPLWVKDRIVAAATYGDTQTVPDGGRIPRFPERKTLLVCNEGDVICEEGLLEIRPPHLTYAERVNETVGFIVDRVRGKACGQ